MNNPPENSESIASKRLEDFVRDASVCVGLTSEKADLLAQLLTTNDLRGNFSHGTRQIATYARLMRDGKLNNQPELSTVRESPVHTMIDGDGGLGYFPAYEAARVVVEKASASGIAIGATRNHGHFGAAGIYARIPVESDLLTFVTSGHQLNLDKGMPLYSAAGGSPMAFSAPTGDDSPIVVDFGCMHDLYANDPHRDEVAQLTPGIVLRSIGMGEICQTWGGLLAGLRLDEDADYKEYEGANQGALIVSFRIDLFTDPASFKTEVRKYVERIETLQPIAPFAKSYAAGVVETARERRFRAEGIPVSEEHKSLLNDLAEELGIEPL